MIDRPISATEAFAMGTLHGILREANIRVIYPVDLNSRQFDVVGLVPSEGTGMVPCLRITIEEVQ